MAARSRTVSVIDRQPLLSDPKLAHLARRGWAATGCDPGSSAAPFARLLGVEPHEIDIATAALPEEVARARKQRDDGRSHASPWHGDRRPRRDAFEVTMLL